MSAPTSTRRHALDLLEDAYTWMHSYAVVAGRTSPGRWRPEQLEAMGLAPEQGRFVAGMDPAVAEEVARWLVACWDALADAGRLSGYGEPDAVEAAVRVACAFLRIDFSEVIW